jgi:hypothetical protein
MSIDLMIASFESRSGNGVFPALARADIAKGLRERVKKPVTQDTTYASLCGPAAFFFCLLHTDPEAYVEFVIRIYESGRAKLGTLEVRPSNGCRYAKPDRKEIAPVDWVALASLRDSENIILSVDQVRTTFAGGSSAAELVTWFQATGFGHITDRFFMSDWTDNPRDNIRVANQLLYGNRWICLLINSQMLDDTTAKNSSMRANHVVVLQKPTDVQLKSVFINVYTWGDIVRVPQTGTLTMDDFCKNYYGFVAAASP